MWNNKLEKMHTEILEKVLRCIKSKDFNELQTNTIENTNFEIENLLSYVEDTSTNTAGRV